MSSVTVSTASNYSYSAMGSGLDGWKNMARGIRIGSRGGANYPPFKNTTFIDSSKIASYYTGAGIIAAILFISLLFTLIGSLGQCGAWVCCKGGIRAKQDRMKKKSPPSFRVKICMLIWVVIIYLLFCLGAFTSYTGGAVLGNSVVSLGDVGVGMLNATGKLVNSTVPNARDWFEGLLVSVSAGVDNSSSYVSSAKLATDGVTPALNNLATTMINAGTGAQSLIDSGNAIETRKKSAGSLISQMIANIASIKTTVTAWQSGVNFSSSYTPSSIVSSFSNPDPSTLASNASADLNGASNVPSFLTNISATPTACSVCAAAVQSASNGMPSLVNQKVLGQSTTVKANLKTQLTTTENNLINSLTSMRDSANSNIGQGTTQLNSFSSSASNYNNSRNIVMIIMSTLILIIMGVIAFFGFRKSSKGVKGCNLASAPVYIVIQLLAIIMFLVAVMIGDVCSSVFDYSPAPILGGLPSGGAYDGVNYIMLLRDQCSAGYSILTVSVNMGLVKASDIDTTALCNSVIDAVDFSPLGDIDLSSLVVFTPDPATILTPLKNLDLSRLNATSLNTLVNTTLPALKSSLVAISAALSASYVSFLSVGATNATATADYNTKKQSMITTLTSYTTSGGIIDQIAILGTAMSTGITNLPAQWAAVNATSYGPATGYYTQSQQNMKVYQNHTSADLTNGIPTIKSNIKSQIAVLSNVLYSNLNCTAIGASLFQFQNAVCGQFLGGLDILWLAYGAIAVAAACAMPVFIWISNRLFYNNLKYVNLGQSPTSAPAPKKSIFGFGSKAVRVHDDTAKIAAPATKKASIIKKVGDFSMNLTQSTSSQFPPKKQAPMKGKVTQLLQALVFIPFIVVLFWSDNLYSSGHALFSRDLSDFAYTAPSSFLGLWTDGFKALRLSLSKKPFPSTILPAEGLSLSTIYTAPIVQYHFGALVLMVLLFLLLILLCVSGCAMCCNSCCCSRRLHKKYSKMKSPNSIKKACAILCLIVPSLLSGICIYIHLAGSQNLTKGLANTKSATVNLLVDTQQFFVDLAPNFSDSIDSLAGSINTSIDTLIASVNFDDFNTKVKPAFFRITAAMYSIESSKEQVIAEYPGIMDGTSYLQKNATTLQYLVGNISAAVNQLSGNNSFLINPYTNDNWTLSRPVSSSLDANSVKSSAENSPNTGSIFGSLRTSANLTTSAKSIEAKINDGVLSAQTTVTNTSVSLKRDISSSLTTGKSAINSGLEGVTTSLGIQTYVDQINRSWVDVVNYDNLRIYGQMGLVLLFCLPVLLISIGGATRSHVVMKGVNLACVPYYALLFFFAIIFLLFSLILGDVCTLVFDENPSSLGAVLRAPPLNNNMISTNESFGAVFHKCVTGSSLLDVASSFGFNSSSFNFSSIANDKISGVNFDKISDVDLSSAVSISSNPASDASSTNVDLSSLTVTPFANVISQTTALKTNLTSLSNQLSTLLGQNETLSGWNISDVPQSNRAYFEFNSAVNAIIGNITYAYQLIDLMQSLSQNLTTSVTNVNTTANNMLGTIGTISPLYNASMEQFTYFSGNATNNLTAAIDPLKNSLIAAIANLSININSDLGCVTIGKDLEQVRQGVCGDTMAAFDSFWSTLVIMALCAFASVPMTVFAANTLFLDLARYQQMDDPEFAGNKNDEDLEKGKSAAETDKAKKVAGHEFAPINVLKTQEYMSPTAQPAPIEEPDDEDDEESEDQKEDQDKEVLVEKDDQQLEFESRQANISIQSDLMQFTPVAIKPPTVMDAVPEQFSQGYTGDAIVAADNLASVAAAQPSIYSDVAPIQVAQTSQGQSEVVEFNTVQSERAIVNQQSNNDEAPALATLEAFPGNDAGLEAFPSSSAAPDGISLAVNPLLASLQGREVTKRKKTLLDIDRMQANSFNHSKQATLGSATSIRRRGDSDANRFNTDNLKTEGQPQKYEAAMIPSSPLTSEQPSEPIETLQAEVEHLKQSIPSGEDEQSAVLHPDSAIPPLDEIRRDSEEENASDSLGSLQSPPKVPKTAKPTSSLKRSSSSVPSTEISSNQLDISTSQIQYGVSASSEVTAVEAAHSQQDIDKKPLQQTLPQSLLSEIINPASAKRLSSFSPEMYSPPKVEPVTEGTKPAVPYDDLITLSKRFKLPELMKVAETLTVDQVAVMDVIEAEGFGISRDAYFKLKRYFISRRKYV